MKSKAAGKRIIWLVILLSILIFIPSYSDRASAKEEKVGKETSVKQELKFFSGTPSAGAAWYILSVGITQIFEKSIPGLKTSLIPGGAGGGPISVGEGQSHAGLVNLGPLLDAYEGLPPFKKAYGNLMLVSNLYDHLFQIIVLKDSGINKITDLKGKIISPGIKGQYSEFWFKKLLKVYNIDPDKDVKIVTLGFGDTVSAMKDGAVDCLATAAPIPLPGVVDLAMARKIKFLNIDDVEAKKFCELVNGFRPTIYAAGEIPYKGEYNDIRTACVPLSVMARTDLPDDLVYKMAKALAENVKDLEQVSPSMRGFDPKNLSRVISPKAKFHPGAEKYYRERGWR